MQSSAVAEQPRDSLPQVELNLVEEGFKLPVAVSPIPGEVNRLVVVEQGGRISLVQDGKRQADPAFLDLTPQVDSGGEKGLLGIAFHPDYATNRKFYVNYTRSLPAANLSLLYTIVSEFKVPAGTTRAAFGSERVILKVKQPYSNHNGGHLAFGPDRLLYIGLGDGGSRMDPENNGQNPKTLLGKMLRIDVDHGDPYKSPADNPFASSAKGTPEVWAYGLRNPWRYSFDRKTGELWAGDVGQDSFEEIDIIKGGANYGWNIYEGDLCHRLRFDCLGITHEPPIVTYGRSEGQSVTGGYVYRGKKFPALDGIYFYADYYTGNIWGLRYEAGKVVVNAIALKTKLHISSFGEDEDGELFVVAHQEGAIYRLVGKGSGSEVAPAKLP